MACIRRYGSLAAAVQASGSHGVALLSHRRVSSFVCNSLQAARRTPTVHLHARVRVHVGAHTGRKNHADEYAEGCIGIRDENGQAGNVEENERTGEARISPCKANLFAGTETEYRLKPSVTI